MTYVRRNRVQMVSLLLAAGLLAKVGQSQTTNPAASDTTTQQKESQSTADPSYKPLESEKPEAPNPLEDPDDGLEAKPEEQEQVLPTDPDGIAAHVVERERRDRDAWRHHQFAKDLPERAEVLSLTVAGGVSLGSYEAGMIHTLTEALRMSPGSARLRVVTGASAGSANALVGAIEACQASVRQPEETLGYKVWVTVGLDQLFVASRVTENSVFVRDPLHKSFKFIEEELVHLPKDCEFVYGLSTTRKSGYQVQLAPGLVVPRLTERFSVHITGRGESVAPAFSNYLDPARSFERPILPLTNGEDATAHRDLRALSQITMASAAFPVAFPAQEIEHCTTARQGSEESRHNRHSHTPPLCEHATRVDPFLDGGVFDNNPLGLAYDISVEGLLESGPAGKPFRAVPEGGPEPFPEVVFGFIDPALRTYPVYQSPPEHHRARRDPLVNVLARIGGQAIDSARGQELATLAERNPQALRRLWLLEASYPPMSELLASFFGFFERDVRDFDFHLGSYETLRDLRERSGTILGVEPFLEHMARTFAGPVEEVPDRYTKLGCILAHVEPDDYEHLIPLCQGAKMHNFRALLQTTIDRLWSNCRSLGDAYDDEHDHLQCKRAQGGMEPPRVDASFVIKKDQDRFRGISESEFEYAMRLLAAYEFEFRDLGLSREKAEHGIRLIRRRLDRMNTALSNQQPEIMDRTLVLTMGRMMINGIYYEPPVHRGYVMWGSSLALGYLGRMTQGPALFFNADLRLNHVQKLVTGYPEAFSAVPSLGVEIALLPISGRYLQSSIGLRGGYQFAVDDAIGTRRCQELVTGGDTRECSQPLIQVPINVSLLERVRVSLTPVFHPMEQRWGHDLFDLEIHMGAELY